MISTITGINYNFTIITENECFYIEAIHKKTMRYSYINNLNTILSVFGIESNDNEKVSESQWIIPSEQLNSYIFYALDFLNDRGFRCYLENKLDEDRECGEWENIKL